MASDSDAIQAKQPPQSLSLDCFALLAMTTQAIRPERLIRYESDFAFFAGFDLPEQLSATA